MGKSLVERYEQILSQDPTSSVFVELAKALLEKGDPSRAIEVCQNGLSHHPKSVTGRVLWGKALIQLGKPALAMEQFDQAIGIDKDNAHAYNLISEVLLQKGLYRSALPILRKASALQPADARVKSWLEQTQQALAGGPAPAITDFTLTSASEPPAESAEPAQAAVEAKPAETTAPVVSETAEPAPRGPSSAPVLVASEPAAPAPAPAQPAPEPRASIVVDPSLGEPESAAAEPSDAPVLSASAPALDDAPAEPRASSTSSGLLDDLPPLDDAAGAAPSGLGDVPPPPEDAPRGGLLGDIPDLDDAPETTAGKGLESTQAVQVAAAEYEKELREKLAASQPSATFWQKNAIKVASIAVVVVALVVGSLVFLNIRAKTKNRNLAGTLKVAAQLISKDTLSAYREAQKELELAVDLDGSNAEAWALTAYNAALLYAEHGRGSDDKARVEAALDEKGVERSFPGHVLAARYLVADAKSREELRRAVLGSKLDSAEVNELAGRILMSRGETRAAVERFKKALSENGGNVRALVAMADYYREAEDHPKALKFYETAGVASPEHPARLVGMAESLLATGGETQEVLAAIEKISDPDALSPELLGRKEWMHGRLLSASGQHEAALKRLSEGSKAFKSFAFQFQLALGEANRAAGKFDAAERAFEAALKLQPRSEDARAELARALIARDRDREVISRFPAEAGARRVSLVRGIAFGRLGDWKKARAELERTEVGGKFPLEAVAWLALADAADGQPERAQEVLEKALAASRRAKPYVRLALGKVYWQRGLLDRARAQFEEAQKDPTDFEGACALGRLLLSIGDTDKAIAALTTSVKRNGAHSESRHHLVRGYLAAGKQTEAMKEAQAWVLDNPAAPLAQKDFALAHLMVGKIKEAQSAIDRAVRSNPSDAEAFRIRAQVLFARGDLKNGFTSLQRANKLNPKDPETFCEIGRAFLRQGKKDLAEAAFEAAEREDEDSYCAAIGFEQLELPGGGRAVAKELLSLASTAKTSWDRVNARAMAARALLGAGAVKDARREAEQAVLAAPTSAQAQFALGLAALKARDSATAAAALTRAVQLDAGDPEMLLALADTLSGVEGELPRAISSYEAYLKLGGDPAQQSRVRKALPALKKKAAGK